MMRTYTLLEIRTDLETCGICGRPAKKFAKIRDDEGWEFYAAHKCARHLLGFDPFKKQQQPKES